MAHAQAGARAGHDVVGQAHVLHAAGDDHLGVAAADRLGAQMQRLEAGAADLVQRQGGHGMWQAGLDCGLACGVLPGAGGQYVAENHFIHLRWHSGRSCASNWRITAAPSSTAGMPASAP